jgi:hypothetical protein
MLEPPNVFFKKGSGKKYKLIWYALIGIGEILEKVFLAVRAKLLFSKFFDHVAGLVCFGTGVKFAFG